jgi:cell wall-associated NlpC family hydrolase
MKKSCAISIVPMRKEPSDRAEIVNQLLFGEVFNIIELQDTWVKILSEQDQYEGWIDKKQAEADSKIGASTTPLSKPIFFQDQFFPAGCFAEIPGQTFPAESIIQIALGYLNTPYLWGGKTHAGIDCSGFTQMVFRIAGQNILRDAYQQAEMGQVISFVEESQTGDLAFFDNEEGLIIHVGMIIRNESSKFPSIIHASGWVRIGTLDNEGIKNENGKQSHRLRIIKRIKF